MLKKFKIFFIGVILILILYVLYYIPKTFIDGSMSQGQVQSGEVVLAYYLDAENPDYINKFDILFKTGEVNFRSPKVSLISFRIRYPVSVAADFSVVDLDGRPAFQISPNVVLEKTQEWMFPVNRIQRREREVLIDFAAINTSVSGFSSNELITIATIYLKPNTLSLQDAGKLTMVDSKSAMYPKSSPSINILNPEKQLLVDAKKIGS